MASDILEQSAQRFGIGPTQRVDDSEFAPPKLSNSTRRYANVQEKLQAQSDFYSTDGRLAREQALLEDAAADKRYDDEMSRMEQAAQWNRKAAIEEQGFGAFEQLKNLTGVEDNYDEEYSKIISQYPLARLDPRVAGTVVEQQRIAQIRRETQNKAKTALESDLEEVAKLAGAEGVTLYEQTLKEKGSRAYAMAAAVSLANERGIAVNLATAGVDRMQSPEAGLGAGVSPEGVFGVGEKVDIAKNPEKAAAEIQKKAAEETSKSELLAQAGIAGRIFDDLSREIKTLQEELMTYAEDDPKRAEILTKVGALTQERNAADAVRKRAAGLGDSGAPESADDWAKRQLGITTP
jgi:hypothetical protein